MQLQWRKLYTKWFDSSIRKERLLDVLDRRSLVEEIAIARIEWSAAQERLDWAIGKDHIDYSIFALEAAEKRYEMLLRIAKQKHWDNTPFQSEKESG
ncbi:DUF2508 family protein [Paenibacillus psychroresistens]|uniref:DUF2508 family protein n=1 Tax=Paenibacillus psychroresistens TaxID=1778678 RepID=A0A6B8RUU3_9BACL|nr:DUF2508 family protein [Paenibacillus psychroresistens]QGQ99223.1 DUF2508 family protein [Paenibacillus psychroresistens]